LEASSTGQEYTARHTGLIPSVVAWTDLVGLPVGEGEVVERGADECLLLDLPQTTCGDKEDRV